MWWTTISQCFLQFFNRYSKSECQYFVSWRQHCYPQGRISPPPGLFDIALVCFVLTTVQKTISQHFFRFQHQNSKPMKHFIILWPEASLSSNPVISYQESILPLQVLFTHTDPSCPNHCTKASDSLYILFLLFIFFYIYILFIFLYINIFDRPHFIALCPEGLITVTVSPSPLSSARINPPLGALFTSMIYTAFNHCTTDNDSTVFF